MDVSTHQLLKGLQDQMKERDKMIETLSKQLSTLQQQLKGLPMAPSMPPLDSAVVSSTLQNTAAQSSSTSAVQPALEPRSHAPVTTPNTANMGQVASHSTTQVLQYETHVLDQQSYDTHEEDPYWPNYWTPVSDVSSNETPINYTLAPMDLSVSKRSPDTTSVPLELTKSVPATMSVPAPGPQPALGFKPSSYSISSASSQNPAQPTLRSHTQVSYPAQATITNPVLVERAGAFSAPGESAVPVTRRQPAEISVANPTLVGVPPSAHSVAPETLLRQSQIAAQMPSSSIPSASSVVASSQSVTPPVLQATKPNVVSIANPTSAAVPIFPPSLQNVSSVSHPAHKTNPNLGTTSSQNALPPLLQPGSRPSLNAVSANYKAESKSPQDTVLEPSPSPKQTPAAVLHTNQNQISSPSPTGILAQILNSTEVPTKNRNSVATFVPSQKPLPAPKQTAPLGRNVLSVDSDSTSVQQSLPVEVRSEPTPVQNSPTATVMAASQQSTAEHKENDEEIKTKKPDDNQVNDNTETTEAASSSSLNRKDGDMQQTSSLQEPVSLEEHEQTEGGDNTSPEPRASRAIVESPESIVLQGIGDQNTPTVKAVDLAKQALSSADALEDEETDEESEFLVQQYLLKAYVRRLKNYQSLRRTKFPFPVPELLKQLDPTTEVNQKSIDQGLNKMADSLPIDENSNKTEVGFFSQLLKYYYQMKSENSSAEDQQNSEPNQGTSGKPEASKDSACSSGSSEESTDTAAKALITHLGRQMSGSQTSSSEDIDKNILMMNILSNEHELKRKVVNKPDGTLSELASETKKAKLEQSNEQETVDDAVCELSSNKRNANRSDAVDNEQTEGCSPNKVQKMIPKQDKIRETNSCDRVSAELAPSPNQETSISTQSLLDSEEEKCHARQGETQTELNDARRFRTSNGATPEVEEISVTGTSKSSHVEDKPESNLRPAQYKEMALQQGSKSKEFDKSGLALNDNSQQFNAATQTSDTDDETLLSASSPTDQEQNPGEEPRQAATRSPRKNLQQEQEQRVSNQDKPIKRILESNKATQQLRVKSPPLQGQKHILPTIPLIRLKLHHQEQVNPSRTQRVASKSQHHQQKQEKQRQFGKVVVHPPKVSQSSPSTAAPSKVINAKTAKQQQNRFTIERPLLTRALKEQDAQYRALESQATKQKKAAGQIQRFFREASSVGSPSQTKGARSVKTAARQKVIVSPPSPARSSAPTSLRKQATATSTTAMTTTTTTTGPQPPKQSAAQKQPAASSTSPQRAKKTSPGKNAEKLQKTKQKGENTDEKGDEEKKDYKAISSRTRLQTDGGSNSETHKSTPPRTAYARKLRSAHKTDEETRVKQTYAKHWKDANEMIKDILADNSENDTKEDKNSDNEVMLVTNVKSERMKEDQSEGKNTKLSPVQIKQEIVEIIPQLGKGDVKPTTNVLEAIKNTAGSQESKLAADTTKVKKETGLQCEICGESFFWSKSLLLHRRLHKPKQNYTCDHCGKSFGWLELLQKHMKEHTGEKPFECDLCHKKFTWDSNLQNHMKTHLGPKQYLCKTCNSTYDNSWDLKRHIMYIHSHPVLSIRCGHCRQTFKNVADLKQHLKVHLYLI